MKTQYTTREEKAAAALRNVRAHRDRQKAKQAAQAARRRPGKGSAPHLSGVSAPIAMVAELAENEPRTQSSCTQSTRTYPDTEVQHWLQQPPYPPDPTFDIDNPPRGALAWSRYQVETVQLCWHITNIRTQKHKDWLCDRHAEAAELGLRDAESVWCTQLRDLAAAFDVVLDHPYHPVWEREFAMRELWMRAQARKIYDLYYLKFL